MPLVPKDREENLSWRRWLAKCGEDAEDRQWILDCCRSDLLFFINSFLWIKQESPVPLDLPFITWPRQDEWVSLLADSRRAVEADRLGGVRGDLLAEKPREVGWTWLTLAEGLHMALFTPGATCLLGSRVEADVDRPGASKTLFWKLDYFLDHLPGWFVPSGYWSSQGPGFPSKLHRSSLKMAIPGGGTILGSATHENFGRSGRYAWMLLDEFAHTDRGQPGMGDRIWAATTKTCRLRRVVSTPNGRGNKFASLRHGGGDSLTVFTVRWHDDPAKMHKAFRLTDEMSVGPVMLAPGDWWSPWADITREADGNDGLFAQEVLLSYEGLETNFYGSLLPAVRHEQVKDACWWGNLRLEETPQGPRVSAFVREEPGFLRFWDFAAAGAGLQDLEWPRAAYVMGIDVASGTRNVEGRGASNSVIAVGRVRGRGVEKVAQYMTHGLLPHRFARIVCAVGWCFKDSAGLPAYAIWERQGAGDIMGNVLLSELHYPNVHLEVRKDGSAQPGFAMHAYRMGDGRLAGSRVNIFNEHKAWLLNGLYAEPSFDTYAEMEQYQSTQDGGAEHRATRASLDPSQGRSNHGDSVIATVLMIWAAREFRDRVKAPAVAVAPPRMSVAWAQERLRGRQVALWR